MVSSRSNAFSIQQVGKAQASIVQLMSKHKFGVVVIEAGRFDDETWESNNLVDVRAKELKMVVDVAGALHVVYSRNGQVVSAGRARVQNQLAQYLEYQKSAVAGIVSKSCSKPLCPFRLGIARRTFWVQSTTAVQAS
eukprot:3484949-Amphidinium_carterae.1